MEAPIYTEGCMIWVGRVGTTSNGESSKF